MKLRQRKALKVLTVFLAFSFTQIYVNAALPEPAPGGRVPQQLVARLSTKNNQPITVNGNSVGTGGTIVTGATIETPDQVSATIDLGNGGVVEIQPGSVIKLDFDENGNVRVKVIRGCAMTQKKTNVLPGEMEVYTDQDSKKTDKKHDHAGGCILPTGQLGSFPGGLSGAAVGGIVAGAVGGTVAIAALTRGEDTSQSSPRTNSRRDLFLSAAGSQMRAGFLLSNFTDPDNMIRRLLCILGALSASFGIWQAARIGAARTLAQSATFANDQTATERAARLLPNDAATHTARGMVLQRTENYPDACNELERAVQLRPRDYFPWMLLGVTRDLNGDQAGALRALRQSVLLAPAYAKPHWLLGNLLLRTGQTDEAFKELRTATWSDQALLPNVIDLAWSIQGSDPAVTIATIQPQTDTARLALAIFLASHKQGGPSIAQFRAAKDVPEESANNLVEALIRSKLFTEAYEVWSRTHSMPASTSLLNASFEDDVAIGKVGFGWLISPDAPNATMSVDTSQSQSGSRSLRIDFHGEASQAGPLVSQIALIDPNKKYRLVFQALSKELVSAVPLIVTVRDAAAENETILGQSPPLSDFSAWHELVVPFSTGANAQAIKVTLGHPACSPTCATFGTLWLDSFRLELEK